MTLSSRNNRQFRFGKLWTSLALSAALLFLFFGLRASAAPQASADAGKDVYDMKCGGCHDGGATGPDLHGLFERGKFQDGTPVSDDNVRAKVMKGSDVMPSFADQLSKEQIDSLIAYLHTLK